MDVQRHLAVPVCQGGFYISPEHGTKPVLAEGICSRDVDFNMIGCMRTTLTIDDDVAATLELVRRNRRISMKDVINEALRLGLQGMTVRERPSSLVRSKSVDLGCLKVTGIDNIAEVLAITADEGFP
jgi:hypothetical protein